MTPCPDLPKGQACPLCGGRFVCLQSDRPKQSAECAKLGLSNFCNGVDLKTVQLRSQAAGGNGRNNEYLGAVGLMCSGCRKSNPGMFKISR